MGMGQEKGLWWKGHLSEPVHWCFLQILGGSEGDIVCVRLVTGRHFELLYQRSAVPNMVIVTIMSVTELGVNTYHVIPCPEVIPLLLPSPGHVDVLIRNTLMKEI